MSKELNKPIDVVADQGSGLIFVVYPEVSFSSIILAEIFTLQPVNFIVSCRKSRGREIGDYCNCNAVHNLLIFITIFQGSEVSCLSRMVLEGLWL